MVCTRSSPTRPKSVEPSSSTPTGYAPGSAAASSVTRDPATPATPLGVASPRRASSSRSGAVSSPGDEGGASGAPTSEEEGSTGSPPGTRPRERTTGRLGQGPP